MFVLVLYVRWMKCWGLVIFIVKFINLCRKVLLGVMIIYVKLSKLMRDCRLCKVIFLWWDMFVKWVWIFNILLFGKWYFIVIELILIL